MTRDAELPARDWVALVRSGLPHETDIGVLQVVMRQAVSALYLFTPSAEREACAGRLRRLPAGAVGGRTCRERPAAGPLSGLRQLAPGPKPSWTLVAKTLTDGPDLEGLALDTDLRWSLVHRLVATGRLDAEGIEAEFERDRTASGERHAAAARAALPTFEDKDRAWQAAVESDDLPNALLNATVAGLNIPDHAELNRAFVDRYFAMIEDVWRTRTNESAQTLVNGLYPSFLVEQDIIDRTEAHLATHDSPPALRRLLLEGADGVRRSLRAQSAP